MVLNNKQLEYLVFAARRGINHIVNAKSLDKEWFNDFHLVNAYLMQLAIDSNKNLSISLFLEELTIELYIPSLYILIYKLLHRNYIEYVPKWENQRILIRNGKCYQIVNHLGKECLYYKDRRGFHKTPIDDFDSLLKTHFIANQKHYSSFKSYTSLNNYTDFFQKAFESDDIPPSLFKYKALIICTRNELLARLKKNSLINCFPSAVIPKESLEYTNGTHPLCPMIFLASDYHGVREYLKHNNDGIYFDYVFIFDDQHIRKQITTIVQDQSIGMFGSFVLIGNTQIDKYDGITKWQWNLKEELVLSGKKLLTINYDAIESNNEFDAPTRDFVNKLTEIRDDYSSTEVFHRAFYFVRGIFRNKFSKSISWENKLEELYKDLTNKLLIEGFDESDISHDLVDLFHFIRIIYETKNRMPCYLDKLKERNLGAIELIVPKDLLNEWQEEREYLEFRGCRFITFNEFVSKVKYASPTTKYVCPNLVSYEDYESLCNLVSQDEVELLFLLYQPEISLLQKMHKKLVYSQQHNKCYKALSLIPNCEDIREADAFDSHDELIGKLAELYMFDDNDNNEITHYQYNDGTLYNIKAETEDLNKCELSQQGSSKVLKISDDSIELIYVKDMMEDDYVRIYNNQSKTILYDVLSENSEQFKKVEICATLWKTRLQSYVELESYPDTNNQYIVRYSYNLTHLNKLSVMTGLDGMYILENWIKSLIKVKFPKRKYLQIILQVLTDECYLTNSERDDIEIYSKVFTSLMIRLGHNLSSEIHNVILNANSFDLSEFISLNVLNCEEAFPMLSKFDTKSIVTLINMNSPIYHILSVSIQEATDE